jgi:hypothetical protein
VPTLPILSPAPRAVRVAGGVVVLQGLAALAFAVAVLVRAPSVAGQTQNLYGEAGFFGVMAVAILLLAANLVIGRPWTRTPTAVLQVLLIAVAWYAIGPSKLVVPAIVTVALCVLALVLLFTAPARAWAVQDPADADPDGR